MIEGFCSSGADSGFAADVEPAAGSIWAGVLHAVDYAGTRFPVSFPYLSDVAVPLQVFRISVSCNPLEAGQAVTS
jgi:hypothetical protein